MISFRVFLAYTLALSTVALSSCTKKGGETPAENPLLTEKMLLKLPVTTAGFTVLDLGGEGYKLLQASPFNSPANAKQSFEAFIEKVREANTEGDQTALDQQLALAQKGYQALEKLGVLSPEGLYTPDRVFSKVVGFVGAVEDDSLPLSLGFFAEGKPTIDMTDKLSIAKDFLSESGLSVSAEKLAGAARVVASFEGAPAKLYLGATKTHLALAIRKADLDGFFSETNTPTLEQLRTAPEFKKATASLQPNKNAITFMYASIPRLAPLLARLAKVDEELQFDPKNVPVESIAGQSAFGQQYAARLNVAISPRTDTQTKVSAALEGSSLSQAATKLPANTAFAISLDAKGTSNLDSLLQSVQNSPAADMVTHLKKLKGVTLGARNNNGGSPVPDIFLSIDSQDRDALGRFIESSLGMALSMTGQNTTWMSKDIDGSSTRYFTTLIGAGVYMSYPKGSQTVLIGTSENLIRDIIAADAGKTPALTASLPKPLQAQFSSYNLASCYFNFNQVGDLVDSVKSTLAMFTGGNSELNDALNSAKLRTFGVGIAGVSYAAGVVSLESSLQPPSVQ